MVELNTSKHFNIVLLNTNKALKEAVLNSSKGDIKTLQYTKDLSSVLNSLLKESAKDPQINKTLLNLVKKNTTLKNLGQVSKDIKNLRDTLELQPNKTPTQAKLQELLKGVVLDIKDINQPVLKQKILDCGVFLESKLKNLQNPKADLQNILKDIQKNLSESSLFNAKSLISDIKDILKSPVFKNIFSSIEQEDTKSLQILDKKVQNVLERLGVHTNKQDTAQEKNLHLLTKKLSESNSMQNLSLKHNVDEVITKDLKSLLLKTHDELSQSKLPNTTETLKHIDKLLLQIDYHQLVSHLGDSSFVYLPFEFEGFEEGSVNIKKDKENKFYCDIELKLKEYGDVLLKLAIYDKNQLDIHIYSKNKEFAKLMKTNLQTLRSNLVKINITPRHTVVVDEMSGQKQGVYEQNEQDIKMGFEVKV